MSIEEKLKHDKRVHKKGMEKYMLKCNKITLPTRKTGGIVTLIVEPE